MCEFDPNPVFSYNWRYRFYLAAELVHLFAGIAHEALHRKMYGFDGTTLSHSHYLSLYLFVCRSSETVFKGIKLDSSTVISVFNQRPTGSIVYMLVSGSRPVCSNK